MVVNETRARPMTLDQEEVFIYSELSRLKHELCDHLASVGVLRLGFAARDAELSRLRAENKALQADAALGRSVRRFREGMALFKQNPEWAFRQGYSGDIIRCDTIEAALKAAGLMEAMHRIANTCENFDGCPVGPQTIAEVAHAALSRAEQAEQKPETCVWDDNNGQTECGAIPHGELLAQMDSLTFCPFCGKRIEVKK